MKRTFEKILENSDIGVTIFTYIHKNIRTDVSYILYKDEDYHVQVIEEKKLKELPKSTIGVIDNGIFLPI